MIDKERERDGRGRRKKLVLKDNIEGGIKKSEEFFYSSFFAKAIQLNFEKVELFQS